VTFDDGLPLLVHIIEGVADFVLGAQVRKWKRFSQSTNINFGIDTTPGLVDGMVSVLHERKSDPNDAMIRLETRHLQDLAVHLERRYCSTPNRNVDDGAELASTYPSSTHTATEESAHIGRASEIRSSPKLIM
jgi:hypothetical protein